MRGFLIIWTLCVGPGPGPEHGSGDRWFAADKAKHFLASAAIETGGYAMMRGVQATRQQSLFAASVATAAAGIGKEVMDRRGGGEFSLRDLAWDAVGGVTMGIAFRHGP
ncbi:MAG TPA: hypothetical protein VG818_08110 [Gemmatimonadaceae bacterium]|jgi:uncharacterized protein YfiM (DUF2279 family)|nr:hypothetical protein [Gemmatimonadaceae bacterium]